MSQHEALERRLRADLEFLCSDACAGRAPGTAGGRAAQRWVGEALRSAGLQPETQAVRECGGANVLAHVRGTSERWVLVAAHFDHLGQHGARVYRGADDNAAAVAMLLALARSLAARPPEGRGVILAAFDCEEPPSFLGGSRAYVHAPTVPLDAIDLMVCMDLVGHQLGASAAPREVRESLFVLGAELADGLHALVDATAEAGVRPRRMNADIIPPLSDYGPFWRRERPFLFLTCGRSRNYHTPQDTPDHLDDGVLAARARWLERLTRAACAHGPITFRADGRDDASTIHSLRDIAAASGAAALVTKLEALLQRCEGDRLPAQLRGTLTGIVSGLEQALA